jgi:DNA-directed RNA polymerase specialized sigma24 family protein
MENLQNLSDVELISLVKDKNNSEAFVELCKKYENIFYKICQRYSTSLISVGLSPSDIYEEKNMIIYHCVLNFKVDKKTKFGSYLGNYARYLCLNSMNARKFILPIVDQESLKKVEYEKAKQQYTDLNRIPDNYNYISNILGQIKDKRVEEIFKYRYLNDDKKNMSWELISKKMGLSVQTIINIHKKNLKLLKTKFQSENISDIV